MTREVSPIWIIHVIFSIIILLILVLYLADEFKSHSQSLTSSKDSSTRRQFLILRSLVILFNCVYLISYAVTYIKVDSEIQCRAVLVSNAIMYYITRLCHYAFFAKRVVIMHENLAISSRKFQWIIAGMSMFAFIAGIVQSVTETTIIDQGNRCNTSVVGWISISCLGIFVALDTIVTIALLKEFVKPIKETISNKSEMNANLIHSERDLKKKKLIRKFEVSCYIASFSTILINILYVITEYDPIIGMVYDVLSAVDSFLHVFAVFYTYHNFSFILKTVFNCGKSKIANASVPEETRTEL